MNRDRMEADELRRVLERLVDDIDLVAALATRAADRFALCSIAEELIEQLIEAKDDAERSLYRAGFTCPQQPMPLLDGAKREVWAAAMARARQEDADPGNPVLAAADAFNAEQVS